MAANAPRLQAQTVLTTLKTVKQFCEETFIRESGYAVSVKDAYLAYRRYLESNGITRHRWLSRKDFVALCCEQFPGIAVTFLIDQRARFDGLSWLNDRYRDSISQLRQTRNAKARNRYEPKPKEQKPQTAKQIAKDLLKEWN